MTQPAPRIAVLIPAYNAEKTIHRALASLAANSEPHDIVLVDDGSDVPLADIVAPQPNLTILRPERNLGITGALNFGLRHIFDRSYDYIARLDADDTATPDRLALQRAFMDRNPDIGLVGGGGRVVSEQGETLFHLNYPADHAGIIRYLNYNSCFIHPTMMMRAEILKRVGGYYDLYPHSAEDYELARRIGRHAKLANMPDCLIDYTMSARGISVSKRRKQLANRLRIQWAYRDAANIHFYLGITQTLALFPLPFGLLNSFKRHGGKYRKR